MSNVKVIIAGGGTGGHFFPAIAIGNALKEKDVEILYMGSSFGIEANVLSKLNENHVLLDIRGIQRSFNISSIVKNMLFPFRFILSFVKSISTIISFKPHVVIGTGGYASGLPLIAAILLNKKTILQEQNSFPGITTRRLSHRVNKVFTAYPDAKKHLRGNIELIGNPVRQNLETVDTNEAKVKLGFDASKPLIFILGGSQGSHPFNMHFSKVHNEYTQRGIQLYWQTGKNDFTWLTSSIENEQVKLASFIEDMGLAYSAADMVISRAGALAIEELKYCKKAMLLVPFPHAAGNHQYENARSLAVRNAALLVKQSEMEDGDLETTIFSLIKNESKIRLMQKNAHSLFHSESLTQITTHVMEMAQA